MNRTVATIGLTALAPISWGSTYAVTTEFLPPDRPLFTGLMRALPAGLALLALARVLPRGAWWWKSAVLGALNIGVFLPLLFLAAYRLPGGLAAVFGSVGPLFAVGLAAMVLGERVTVRKVLTALAAAFGVSLVVLKATAGLDLIGVLAALAGTASMSAGTILTKRWGRPEGVGPLAMTAWQLTMGDEQPARGELPAGQGQRPDALRAAPALGQDGAGGHRGGGGHAASEAERSSAPAAVRTTRLTPRAARGREHACAARPLARAAAPRGRPTNSGPAEPRTAARPPGAGRRRGTAAGRRRRCSARRARRTSTTRRRAGSTRARASSSSPAGRARIAR